MKAPGEGTERMGLRGVARWAGAGLLVAGLAGCGTGGTGDGAAADSGVPTVRTEEDLPELPLDRYEFSTKDARRHTKAQALLAQQCMKKLGYDDFPLYPQRVKDTLSVTMVAVAMSSYPYGPLDLDAARDWGYGYDPRKKTGAQRPEGRLITQEENEALYGARRGADGGGGCSGAGTERLVEGVSDKTRMWTYTARRTQHLDKAAVKDARVREALGTWSRCMADKGVKRYKDPKAAFGDKAWGRSGRSGRQDGNTTRTRRELATAVADVECKREHNTAGVWWAVRQEKQRADVARHKDAYDAVRADQDRVRAHVRRALGEERGQ
ncbi:hypothetical protein ACIBKX_19390 [Streptomyces sp. NPDC050658]|uniref:hypothetical protein n=1 Tax=unclassified Streptomyces TaxID=2593676 RepID=UPI00342E2450